MGTMYSIKLENNTIYDFFVLNDENYLERLEHVLDVVEHIIPYDSWTWQEHVVYYGTCRFTDVNDNLYDVCYSPESHTFHIISVPVR